MNIIMRFGLAFWYLIRRIVLSPILSAYYDMKIRKNDKLGYSKAIQAKEAFLNGHTEIEKYTFDNLNDFIRNFIKLVRSREYKWVEDPDKTDFSPTLNYFFYNKGDDCDGWSELVRQAYIKTKYLSINIGEFVSRINAKRSVPSLYRFDGCKQQIIVGKLLGSQKNTAHMITIFWSINQRAVLLFSNNSSHLITDSVDFDIVNNITKVYDGVAFEKILDGKLKEIYPKYDSYTYSSRMTLRVH